MAPAEEARARRQGQRQLDALLAAYRRDPEALVRTSFTPADEPGIAYEELTIRELARTHLETAELLVGEAAHGGDPVCTRRVARVLRELDD